MIVFGVMFGLVILMALPFASAQPILISIVQSDTCERSTSCLDLKDLKSLDTSDQRISGTFKMLPDGDYMRSKPQYKNHWEFYKLSKSNYTVCVGCDLGFQSHSKVITIESNPNFKYILQKDHKIVNNTFYEYNGRYIDSCSSAVVSSNLDLIQDTIQYLGNNCKTPSRYNEKTTTVKPSTPMTDCSYACQNAKFFKEAKEKSKKTFLINPNIKLKTQNDKVRVN
jgi:hypothetical protein